MNCENCARLSHNKPLCNKCPKGGKLNIGLPLYAEDLWIKSIKEYGIVLMNKSLLSRDQKQVLIEVSKKR
jgi:hypothetical protein